MENEIVNILCMKWGKKYTANDVNILFSMVQRNLSLPFRFVCFTDDKRGIRSEVECFDIPEIDIPEKKAVSPWKKLVMFKKDLYDLKGKALFLDLDIVIMDKIDCFFDHSEKFTIIENWTQKGEGIGNSSVYCFEIGKYSEVYEYYQNNFVEVTDQYRNEQIYLSKKIGDIEFWPDSWCKSFKRHSIPPYLIRYFVQPKKPEGVKILVFHGNPKPEDAIKGGFYGNIFKYIKPCKWIEENWK